MQKKAENRKLGRLSCLVIFILLPLLALVIFVVMGAVLVIADPLEKADAIVVLSGGEEVRLQEAISLYQEEYAETIILTETGAKVEGYNARDGVEYNYFTTLEGIIEKDNPQIYDYRVPERMKELFARKDYGRYAQPNGTMPVCFTASNHTTGGNSGSPVIDANGYLIGINFDRCWEGTMSDIMFDPEKCRNIALDMRYMLFVIDKFAQAGYLLNEMKIIE